MRRGDEAMAYLGRNRELGGEGGPAVIRRGGEAQANFQSSGEESGLGMLRSADQQLMNLLDPVHAIASR
jgi:hypothetical protein